jgi:hypothetical protein
MLFLPSYQIRKLDHNVGAADQRQEKDVSNRMRCAGDLLYVHNSSIFKTEVQGFSETTVNFDQIIWCYTRKDNTHQGQWEGNTYRLLSSVTVEEEIIVGFYVAILSIQINLDGANQNSIQIVRAATD